MGCGKTSTAKRLAKNLDYSYLDMDDMLEKEYHISICDIFAKYDEDTFRKLEQAVLHKTFSLDDTIISTGGGTACFEDNMKQINDNGVSIYLKMSPKMLRDRLVDSPKPRPLIQKVPKDQHLSYIEDLLKKREKYYLQANHVVDGKNLDVSDIIKLLF